MNPFTIAVAATKGGVGKTTTAVALAEILSTPDTAAMLVDTDPQGSASRWCTWSAAAGTPASWNLTHHLPADGFNPDRWVVIDTPTGVVDQIAAAVSVADVVVIPTTPSPMDLVRVKPTADLAGAVGTPALVLLTMVPTRSADVPLAFEVLEAFGVPVAATVIPTRARWRRSYGTRIPADLLETYRPLVAELAVIARKG